MLTVILYLLTVTILDIHIPEEIWIKTIFFFTTHFVFGMIIFYQLIANFDNHKEDLMKHVRRYNEGKKN